MTKPATPKPVKIGVKSTPTCDSAISKPIANTTLPDIDVKKSCIRRDNCKFGDDTALFTILRVSFFSQRNAKIMAMKSNNLKINSGALLVNHSVAPSPQVEIIDKMTSTLSSSSVNVPVVSNNCCLYCVVSKDILSASVTKNCNVVISLFTLR